MADRDRGTPIALSGPWEGLDTTHQPRELSSRHAVRANNILLDNGTIKVRPPFVEDGRFAFFPAGTVYAGVDWYPPSISGSLEPLVSILHVDNQLFTSAGGGISPVQRRQGSFAFATGRLYYADGRRVFRFDGQDWVTAGIPSPTTVSTPTATDSQLLSGLPRPQSGQVLWAVQNIPQRPASLQWNTAYEFAFTWYDSGSGVESNAVYTGTYDTGNQTGPSGHPMLKLVWGQPPQQRGAGRIRAYVRNVTAGQSYFLLLYDFPVANGIYPPADYSFIPVLGDPVTGPFAPVKNGVPEYATVCWYYKERMFYNDIRHPTLLRYSALGRPEHVATEDFENLDDDGGQITGMGEQAGQLVVIKERSIWIVSGIIVRPTNETIAQGVGPLPSSHEVYKTKATIGCSNKSGGNGAILVNGRIHYNNLHGFHAFDGVAEQKVSDLIDPTWRDFVGDTTFGHNQAVTYNDDVSRKIIFMANQSTDQSRTKILAYHYGLQRPAWTTIEPDDPGDNPTCIISLIGTQAEDAPVEPDGRGLELLPSGLVIAVAPFRILAWDDHNNALPMPRFEYRTGDLVVKEGLNAHFYWAKWLIAKLPPGALQRVIETGFRLWPEDVDIARQFSLVGTTRLLHKIEGQGETIALFLRNASDVDARWHEHISILGIGMDAEPVGQ